MAFETEFLDLMPHTITVYPFASVNEYAEATHSTSGTSYRAYIQEMPSNVLDTYGEEVVASHTVYVASTSRIPMTSKVVMPDGQEPFLIRSDVMADEDGTAHHIVLFFGGRARGN
jgi:hypothetical protein